MTYDDAGQLHSLAKHTPEALPEASDRVRHLCRNDNEMCLCGHDPYYTCPDWLNDGSIGNVTFRARP